MKHRPAIEALACILTLAGSAAAEAPPPDAAPSPAPPPAAEREPAWQSKAQDVAAVALIAGGAVTFGVGSYIWLDGLSVHDDVDRYREECEGRVDGGCQRFEGTLQRARSAEVTSVMLLASGFGQVAAGICMARSYSNPNLTEGQRSASEVVHGSTVALSVGATAFAVLALKTQGETNDAADACASSGDRENCYDANDINTNAVISGAVGAVTLVVPAVLMAADYYQFEAPRVAASVGRDHAELVVSGEF